MHKFQLLILFSNLNDSAIHLVVVPWLYKLSEKGENAIYYDGIAKLIDIWQL